MPSVRVTTVSRQSPVHRVLSAFPGLSLLVTVVLSFMGSKILMDRYGLEVAVLALTGLIVAIAYTIISYKWILIPFLLWIVTTGGFRFIYRLENPLLPDLFLDRILMVWVLGIFSIKFFAERRKHPGPYVLDILLLTNLLYLLTRVYIQGMEFSGPLTQCVVIPYFAYFIGKNIITDYKSIRIVLLMMLLLVMYYTITSIAEKFHVNWLIWPKYILTETTEFKNRSVGPLRQAAVFGTIIGMLLPVHMYFIVTTKRWPLKLFLLTSLGLGFAGLYFTYTRGSWLAGIAALATISVISPTRYLKTLLPVLIIAPVIGIVFLGMGQDKFMQERMENENTLGSRMATAVTTMRIFRDHPLLGIGFFQYRNVLDEYVQPVDIPGWETIRFVQFRHNPIHDIYLGPLAENGILGALLQASIYFVILRSFLRKYRKRQPPPGLAEDPIVVYVFPVLAALMVGYLIGGLAFDYRYFAVVDTFFYLCAGIIYGHDDVAQYETSATNQLVKPASTHYVIRGQ